MWFLATLKPKTPQQRKLGHWGPELPRLPLAPTPKADVPHQKSGQNQPKFPPKIAGWSNVTQGWPKTPPGWPKMTKGWPRMT